MDSVQTWGEAIYQSLIGLFQRFIDFIPSLFGALFVFLAGMIVATALAKAVEKLVNLAKVDQVLEKMGFGENFKKAGLDIRLSVVFGQIVKWFLILVFLMAASDILGLTQVTDFLNSILLYIPNIVVAVIILSVAFVVGHWVFNIVRSSTRVAGITKAEVVAVISKWSIFIFGILAALIQLGIAASLVNTLFIGLVAALSLALGLAFGLGGREEAALILKKVRQDLESQ